MKIVVDEKEFNEIIRQEAVQYEYEHRFMHPDETLEDFMKTKRWYMMKSMQSSIRTIKNRLMSA